MATSKEITAETRQRMKKAVSHLHEEFGSIRTGRASPAQVEKIMVDYYGAQTPLQQLAGFSVPEPRVLVVQPYDKGAMKAIEKAIQQSDLGINPGNDGQGLQHSGRRCPGGALDGGQQGVVAGHPRGAGGHRHLLQENDGGEVSGLR